MKQHFPLMPSFRPRTLPRVAAVLIFCTLLFGLLGVMLLQAQEDAPAPPVAGPGWHQATAQAVTPAQARRVLSLRAKRLPPRATAASETDITPEIAALATALENDPRRIFDFVHNRIDFVPTFGSVNGAQATLLARRGNDWDQASLLIALLRAAGFTADYQSGDVVYSNARLVAWTGAADGNAALNILVNGGIPAEGSTSPAGVKVTRAWVQAQVDGQTVLLDPALKTYQRIDGVNVGQALGYDRAALLAAVQQGATVSQDSVQNLNRAGLEAHLTTLSSNFVNFIETSLPTASVADAIGGRVLVESRLDALPTALPDALAVSNVATHAQAPDSVRHTVRVEQGSLDRTFRTHEIAGKRLSLFFDGPGNAAVLRLEGQPLFTGTATALGSSQLMTISVDHPYAAQGGVFADQTATFRLRGGGRYVIAHSFNTASQPLMAQRNRLLDGLIAAGAVEGEALLAESLWLIGLAWQHQATLFNGLVDQLAGIVTIQHHQIGIVAQEEGFFIDLPLNFTSATPRTRQADIQTAFRVQTLMASAFEHGVLEQLQNSDPPAVSTVKLLGLSNDLGRRTFLLNSGNIASLKPQLQNYSAQQVAQFEAGVNAGRQFVLPENGQVELNKYRGVGFVDELPGANSSSIAMVISGGFFGGFNTEPGQVSTPTLESKLDRQVSPSVLQGNQSIPLSGDPVDMASGTFVYEYVDTEIGLPAPLGLDFLRSYNSALSEEFGPLGFGWRHNYEMAVEISSFGDPVLGTRLPADIAPLVAFIHAGLDLLDGDRSLLDWMTGTLGARWAMDRMVDNLFAVRYGSRFLLFVRRADGSFTSPPGTGLKLQADASGFQLIDFPQDQVLFFDTAGRLRGLTDRNGNSLQLVYDGNGRLQTVTDATGGVLALAYDGAGLLTTITDPGGRQISYTYSDGNLSTSTDLAGNVWRYEYDDRHRLTAVFYPQTPGQAIVRNVYDSQGRVTKQTDALGNETNYLFSDFRSIETRADGSKFAFEFDGQEQWISREDSVGNRAEMAYDNLGHRSAVTDRLGDTTRFTYLPQTGELASITNPKGDTTSLSYNFQQQVISNPLSGQGVTVTFSNLASVSYPDGGQELFTHDAQGRTLTREDQAGFTWRFAYNARGQVTQITNPVAGVVAYTHNPDGTIASSTDSDEGVTTYAYDAHKRLTQITRPDGSTFRFAYTASDRIASLTNENNQTYAFAYDANNNLVRITDPAGQALQYAYDPMDQPTQFTDRLGKTTHFSYDALNRLQTVTDPAGAVTGYDYDARGWLAGVTQDGKRWQTDYDAEGLPIARTTPLDNKTTSQRDALGYLSRVIDALGQSTSIDRDSLGRIVRVTDPLGRATAYQYDNRGLLTEATGPALPAANYTRNGLGQLTRLTDLNGQNWDFAYSSIARVQSQTDPLQQTLQHTYDQRGRLLQTTYPTGVSVTRTYDPASHLTRLQYSDGLDIQYGYDALGRLVSASGVTLTRDAEGRITNTQSTNGNFGATFDDAGRLLTATYADGAVTVTYAYSPTTGLLMAVSDSLSGARVDFVYDGDLRLVAMNRSNGVNSRFTRDAVGRVVRIQEGGLIDLQYTLDAAGQVIGLAMQTPLDPVDALTAGVESFAYDAASQINSTGYAYDAMGRLTAKPGGTFTWDGASRLVARSNGSRAGDANVTLAYNGLRDLIARTEDGTTVRYDYNYAINLAPIVAEQNAASGQFRRFYVWTPDGELLYLIDAASGNQPRFYHFDRTGSTLALTDAAGQVTDAYAYTPDGVRLAQQGNSSQPFTFVGRWGVRQEGADGTLYHMRFRYYDAVSGRFLSRDPRWPQLRKPEALNPYQYAGNDPANGIDPIGLDIYELQRPIKVDKTDDWMSWVASFVGDHYQVFIETDQTDAQGRPINYVVDANNTGMTVSPVREDIETYIGTDLNIYNTLEATGAEGTAVVDIFKLLKPQYKYVPVCDDCGETVDYAQKALEEVRELKTAEQQETVKELNREIERKKEYKKNQEMYAAKLEEAKARIEKEAVERLKTYVLELRKIDETTAVGQERFEDIIGDRETPNK